MEISTRIANLLRDIARAEGRSEEEVLDDALALYQRWVPEHHSAEQFAEFQAFLNQMSSRFDLDEDEAMRIARGAECLPSGAFWEREERAVAERGLVTAVLDPNVLISAAISAGGAPRALLVYWYLGRFQMLVSYELLYELEAVLLRPKFRSKLTVSDVLTYVRWLRRAPCS